MMPNYNYELITRYEEDFKTVLDELRKQLFKEGYVVQSATLSNLLEYLAERNFAKFIKVINSVDMWGGAGAVWEVNFDNKADANKFEDNIIKLIDLMDRTNILGKGIKQIRTIFKKNLKM